jgi:HAMP domain-containing protein
MKNKLERKLAWIIGAASVAWFAYGIIFSFSGVIGALFNWRDAFLILLPLAALVSLFAFLMSGDDETTTVIKKKLISLYIITIAALFFVVSPIEDFLILNITGSAVAIDVLTYLVMAVCFGGVVVVLFMRWFKPIGEFMRKYQSDVKDITPAEVSEISRAVSWFPFRTALTSAILSSIGYLAGSATFFLVHTNTPPLLILDNILIGAAMGPIVFSIIYFFSRAILEGVGSVLYVFKDIALPQRVIGLERKVLSFSMFPGIFFTITSITLSFNLISGRISAELLYIGLAINFIFTALLVAIIGRGIVSSVISALHEIKHGMVLIQSGNWTHRVSVRTGDEIEDIAYEFNKMAEHLEKHCK